MNKNNNKTYLLDRGVRAEQYLGGYEEDRQIFKRYIFRDV